MCTSDLMLKTCRSPTAEHMRRCGDRERRDQSYVWAGGVFMATTGGKQMHGVSRVYGLEQHLFRIKNVGKETNRPKKCIKFLLRTDEYFAFYRTFNRVYSISIDLIIFNNYIDAQTIRITDVVIFCHVTDPGLTATHNESAMKRSIF